MEIKKTNFKKKIRTTTIFKKETNNKRNFKWAKKLKKKRKRKLYRKERVEITDGRIMIGGEK